MEVGVGRHRQNVADALMREGRFFSSDEAVEESLRLVKKQEKKLRWLRAKVRKAIDEGGDRSEADIRNAFDAAAGELRHEGY